MSDTLTAQLYQLLLDEGLQPERLPGNPVAGDPTLTTAASNSPSNPASNEQIHSMRLSIQGKNAEWVCLVRVFEQTERVLVYSILPSNASEAQRPDLALMLTEINYGLIVGNFEMDLDDGEIRYKTSLDVEGIPLNSTVLRNLLYGNFFSMDLYYHALTQALDGHSNLQQLIYQAEHPDAVTGFDLVDDIVH